MTVLRDIAAIAAEAANIVVALTECKLSDQCRRLGSSLAKGFIGIGFLFLLLLLLAAALVFVLFGLYLLLATRQNPPAAAMMLGGVVLLAGLILCWLAVRMPQKNN